MKRWISSAALRLLAKQSVRRPRSTRAAISLDASPSALAAQAELLVEQRRVPERDRALGARRGVVVDDRDVERRVSERASSPGFAIVAEASRNCGSAP